MKNYIPKSKFDLNAVEILKSLEFESIRADVPELLEWMQDMHWPVAHEIAKYLIPHAHEIKEELLFILNTEDAWWKQGIICCLIAKSSNKPDPELISIIKRIAEHPTKSEIEEGLNITTKEMFSDNRFKD